MKALLQRQVARSRADGWSDLLFVPLLLAGLVVYLSTTTEFFLTSANLTTLLLQGSILAIVAFGLTFVVFAGELDLSVGSGVALVSVVTALVLRDTGSLVVAVAAGIGTGVTIGIINGAVVTLLRVPSFIVTFGMLVIAQGAALALTGGGIVAGLPHGIGSLVQDSFLGIRLLVWLVFVVFVLLYFLQSQTLFGVRVFAVGGNREAARLSGLPVEWIRFWTFVISGAAVGIAGVALVSRVESGQPNSGGLLALTAIVAIVVGGNHLLGGKGSLVKTVIGLLLITVLQNGLDLKGVDDNLQEIIIGVVFIAAASVDFVRLQLRRYRVKRISRRRAAASPGAGPAAAAVGDPGSPPG